MEEKELEKEENKRGSKLHWKLFLKDQVFLMLVGILSFICFLTIYFLKKDIVYLYLTFIVPCLILLWIGLSAIVLLFKEKNKRKIKD